MSTQEFEQLPLRVHDFLVGVPLHDVWLVDLPRARSGITLGEFLKTTSERPFTPSPVVRALLSFRLFIGRLLGWDCEPAATAWQSFAARITDADRSKSLVPPGMREDLFRVVYRFENEQLLEIINRTAHAAALSALVENRNGYRFYFAVYVQNVGRFTRIYMALIDPFRKLVVYPSLLRSVSRNLESNLRYSVTGGAIIIVATIILVTHLYRLRREEKTVAMSAKFEITWRNPQAVQRRQRWEAQEVSSNSSLYVIQEFLSTGEHGFWNTTCRLQVLSDRGSAARRNWHRRAG